MRGIPCLSQATTLSTPFQDDLPAYARAGWTAIEIWLTKLEQFLRDHDVAEASRQLADHGLRPVAASLQGGLLLSRGAGRLAHWDHFRRRLETLRELGVPTLVIASDFASEPADDDLSRALDSLAQASALAAEHGVRLALEPQKTARFGSSLDTVLALVRRAGGVGVCLDLFHYYTGPSKFEDLDHLRREDLALVQLCSLAGTPRELATDADRILPGEGDFQLEPILARIERLGYEGPISVELMNPRFWQAPAEHVADLALRALQRCLDRSSTSLTRGS